MQFHDQKTHMGERVMNVIRNEQHALITCTFDNNDHIQFNMMNDEYCNVDHVVRGGVLYQHVIASSYAIKRDAIEHALTHAQSLSGVCNRIGVDLLTTRRMHNMRIVN